MEAVGADPGNPERLRRQPAAASFSRLDLEPVRQHRLYRQADKTARSAYRRNAIQVYKFLGGEQTQPNLRDVGNLLMSTKTDCQGQRDEPSSGVFRYSFIQFNNFEAISFQPLSMGQYY